MFVDCMLENYQYFTAMWQLILSEAQKNNIIKKFTFAQPFPNKNYRYSNSAQDGMIKKPSPGTDKSGGGGSCR